MGTRERMLAWSLRNLRDEIKRAPYSICNDAFSVEVPPHVLDVLNAAIEALGPPIDED
jgi:hypothetical protein